MPSSLFIQDLKSIGRRQRLLSLGKVGETNAVEPSLCFSKIAGKVNQGRKNATLLCLFGLIEHHLLKLYEIPLVGQQECKGRINQDSLDIRSGKVHIVDLIDSNFFIYQLVQISGATSLPSAAFLRPVRPSGATMRERMRRCAWMRRPSPLRIVRKPLVDPAALAISLALGRG
jgi:hypothetical protein